MGHEATNPKRVGGLARDKPSFVRTKPWSGARKGKPQEGRTGEGRSQRTEKENPGGDKAQESYAPDVSLNRCVRWWTLARSKTLKAWKRQEGSGAGNGVRLRGRNKALKGEPQERIRHETRPVGSGRMKAPGG
jgi:hypothetical protein